MDISSACALPSGKNDREGNPSILVAKGIQGEFDHLSKGGQCKIG